MWQDVRSGDITVQEVLEFLKTAYQVHEAVEGVPVRVDWFGLSSSPLLAKLKERELLDDETQESTSYDDDGKVRRCSSLEMTKRRNSTSAGSSRQSSLEKSADRDKKGNECRRLVTRRRNSLTPKKESNIDVGSRTAERYIKRKLNQVLQEGILDSVLPYILSRQSQPLRKVPAQHLSSTTYEPAYDHEKSSSSPANNSNRPITTFVKKDSRRKSTSSMEGKSIEKDVEVVIHVCDEVKNMKKDFRCSQSLLVSRMRYFGEVTAGQKLEDMDISVHCDVSIFDWLIRWVKQEGSPTLDASIVIPVLMSSAFLQMDSLQETCLQYCRSHINEIIKDSSNLGCINDSVLTRLADMFSNTEVEALKDRKDKLLSKLYCKLITFLAEPVPQHRRGHYYSLAYLFRCSKCGRLISQPLSLQTSCIPRHIKMNQSGHLQSKHVKDPSWSLTALVRQLKNDLKTWRKVYWRLWGLCHHLKCSFCATPFPLNLISSCNFHPEVPQFFSMEHQRSMSFPVGRYPCCGVRAFRFEVLPSHNGCQQRDHMPEVHTDLDKAIMKIFKEHRDLIRIEMELEEIEIERNIANKEALWWEGLELAPVRIRPGLLGSWLDPIFKQNEKRGSGETRIPKTNPSVPAAQPLDTSSYSDSSDSDSSASCGESEESYHATVRVTTKPRGAMSSMQNVQAGKDSHQVWVSKLSTRCNQDNQREFEERALRHIEKLLTRKTSAEGLSVGLRSTQHDQPGGTYVRLEAEWREAHCSSHGCPGSSKSRLTSSKPKVKR